MPTETATPTAPVPGSPEHDAAMAARFDASQGGTPPVASTETAATVERPAHIPEKFWDAEKGAARWDDMAKSYAELEKKVGQPPKADEPAKPADPLKIEKAPEAEAPKADEPPKSEEDAAKKLDQAGLSISSLSEEFAEKGELSAESYEKLTKAGIPKDYVDAYIEGQKALAEVWRNQVFTEAGGEQEFNRMVLWAGQNLSQAEITVYNDAVDSRDMAKFQLAVAGVKAKYTAANGSEPTLLKADTLPAANDTFRSTAELTAAMKDPRYAKDEAYRQDVMAKLGRSNIL